MKLSDRIRPDVEAAPWVIEEVKKLERQNEALEKQVPKWVPVHAQIPPEDHAILLAYDGLPFIGRKRYGLRGEPAQDQHTYRATCCGRIAPAVTHWMPLPAPSQESSHD